MNAIEERNEQIRNTRAAYHRGDITLTDLLWYAVLTLKHILGLAR